MYKTQFLSKSVVREFANALLVTPLQSGHFMWSQRCPYKRGSTVDRSASLATNQLTCSSGMWHLTVASLQTSGPRCSYSAQGWERWASDHQSDGGAHRELRWRIRERLVAHSRPGGGRGSTQGARAWRECEELSDLNRTECICSVGVCMWVCAHE